VKGGRLAKNVRHTIGEYGVGGGEEWSLRDLKWLIEF
jgi:hypothetical protein